MLTTPDAFLAAHEVLPALLRYTSHRHWTRVASREHKDLDAAFTGDMTWNGEPMPEISAGISSDKPSVGS